MKKLLLLLFVVLSLKAVAQTVGYTYRPFAAEGCKMNYSVMKQDTAYYKAKIGRASCRERV